MARINHTLALVTLAIMLASTGCGDAASFEETSREDSSRIADDGGSTGDTILTLEDELQLACEAYCEAATSCRHALFRKTAPSIALMNAGRTLTTRASPRKSRS